MNNHYFLNAFYDLFVWAEIMKMSKEIQFVKPEKCEQESNTPK